MSDAITDYPIVYDVSLDGKVKKNGEISQVWNKEALVNALKMWIASYKGEYIRNPEAGGYVTKHLMKPMRQDGIDAIKSSIRNGISDDFRPFLRIRQLEVVPNYEKRYWRIYMEVYSPDLKVDATVDEKIKNQV